jgi:hypothetical protein
MKSAALALLLLILACPPPAARADILLLKGGGRVEGVVTDLGESYRVSALNGRAWIRKERVVGRVETPYVTEVYERRRAEAEEADPDAQFRLALWCEGVGLEEQAETHLRLTLLVAPNHERARARLRHVRYRGVWMTPEEAKAAAMAAAGYISFEGKWFTESGLRAYLEAKMEAARVEALVGKLRAERAEAELEAELRAEELARKQAERKLLEEALARAEEDRRERERLQREVAELRSLLRDIAYRRTLGVGYATFSTFTPVYVLPRYGTSGAIRPCGGGIGPRLAFEWRGDNFRIRGRVR